LSVTPSVRADDTWHNIYHTLKRFFTGETSSNHRAKRLANHVRTNRSPEPASMAAEGTHESGASPTPRVVVLPAASPAAESDQAILSSPEKPEAAATPEASPNLTPVLLSLPLPTPSASPRVLPSATPGTGNETAN
jgi:hypothetical protein